MGARNHMLIKFGTLSQRSLTFVQRKLAIDPRTSTEDPSEYICTQKSLFIG